MMTIPNVCWLTDIHVDFLSAADKSAFFDKIAAMAPSHIFITGDTCESDSLEMNLRELARRTQCPIYFVLGNHDYYRGTVLEVRLKMDALCRDVPNLVFLTNSMIIHRLTESVGLLGHDGWADMRFGNTNTPVRLNDDRFIKNINQLPTNKRIEEKRLLADQAAWYIRATLPVALASYDTVIFLTHVPPFAEAAWHEGRMSDPDFLPHFTCWASGDAMAEVMHNHPGKRLVVLCGHTHGSGTIQAAPNIRVITGGNEYYSPIIQPTTFGEMITL